jgi:NCAIR mutase (PurE)-related protein
VHEGPPARFADLGFARLDTDRANRTGDPEVIYGAGKTVGQALGLVTALRRAHPDRLALVTRATPELRNALREAYGASVTVDDEATAAAVGPWPAARGRVCVLSAGTSDGPVAAEAAFTARAFGTEVDRVADVGVAGIHRLLAVRDRLDAADCLVVLAGMDGALPSAVGGLTGVPLVAVPTSVGYGASYGGIAALLAMLNSCAPGVVVTNIDNGFGAGVFAARVARRAAPRVAP